MKEEILIYEQNVYRLANQMVIYIYFLLEKFPDKETNSLAKELKISATSVPSNLAEEMEKQDIGSKKDFNNKARKGLNDMVEQLKQAQTLRYISKLELKEAVVFASKIGGSIKDIEQLLSKERQ